MYKIIKKLLFLSLFFINNIFSTETNKTYLMPRPVGVNLPMEYTTFNNFVGYKKGNKDNIINKNDNNFGAHIQATPYYLESNNGNDIGKYFGFDDKNILRIARNNITGYDLDFRYMVHDNVNTANTNAIIKLDPKFKSYGLRLDYYQTLDNFLDGLYFKIAVPISYVKTDVRLNISDQAGYFVSGTATDFYKYFDGTYNIAKNNARAQEALEYSKISQNKFSKTGVADVDLVLGCKFIDREKYYALINFGLTIPTTNDVGAGWMFDVNVGNGSFWAVGGGVEGSLRLFGKDDNNLNLVLVANYRYLFEDRRERTLGLLNPDGTRANWGQYYLVGEIGTAINDQQLKPAANVLTRRAKISPGSQFDSMLYLNYKYSGFSAELGYNFFWKDDEQIEFKQQDQWQNNIYGVALLDQDMSIAGGATFANTGFAATAVPVNGGSIGYINNEPDNTAFTAAGTVSTRAFGLDEAVGAASSQNTHKIFAGLGYAFYDFKFPCMLGIGSAYEFNGSDGIENWQVYGKLGVKF